MTNNSEISQKLLVTKLFWPVVAFILLSLSACRIEVGTGKAVAAQGGIQPAPTIMSNKLSVDLPALPSSQPVEIEQVSSTISSSEILPTATLIPASSSVVTPTPTVTPSSTPVIPAQSPPTRILIPRIDLDVPIEVMEWKAMKQGVTESSVWLIPDNSAGWHKNSALPGHNSNIVLSGHHNLGAKVFRDLVNLQKGDKIILKADGRDYHYTLMDHFILPERGVSEEQKQQNLQWIMPTSDERLTLVTCWPYNDNSHRLIIVAK